MVRVGGGFEELLNWIRQKKDKISRYIASSRTVVSSKTPNNPQVRTAGANLRGARSVSQIASENSNPPVASAPATTASSLSVSTRAAPKTSPVVTNRTRSVLSSPRVAPARTGTNRSEDDPRASVESTSTSPFSRLSTRTSSIIGSTSHTRTPTTPRTGSRTIHQRTLAEQMADLHSRKEEGAITQEEYDAEHQRLLEEAAR